MEFLYSFQMEAQVPPASVPMQHGFVLGEFAEEANMDLAMMESTMDDLHMEEAPLNGFFMDDLSMNDLSIFRPHDPWEATGLAYRSREPSVLVPQPPKHPSTEDWNRIKPIFTKLYSKENKTLKEVKAILEREHGFYATERMYKPRIKDWNLHKNLTEDRRATMVRKVMRRGKADGLLLNGRPVQHRLERYCKAKNVSPEDLVTSAPRRRQRRSASPVRVVGQSESAEQRLQSFFRSPSQPLASIASYGNTRIFEDIFWNTEVYLGAYLTTGPGSRFYRKQSDVAVQSGFSGHSLVFVRNDEVWKDTVSPVTVYNNIFDGFQALRNGFIASAFKSIREANGLIMVILEQQHPTLLAHLVAMLNDLMGNASSLAQKTLQYILEMATTVFGSSHPLATIVNKFYALSSAGEMGYVWRGVTDAFDRSFAVLEDSEVLEETRLRHFDGLRNLGQLNEAQTYLNVIYSKNGRAEDKNPEYILEKAFLLWLQNRSTEAEIKLRELMGLVEKVEDEVFSDATPSGSSLLQFDAFKCIYVLADTLEDLERIEEAKAMYWRAFKLASAAWGPDDVDTEWAGSELDDFLTNHGFVEESAALKAQYPHLLLRQELSPEDLQQLPVMSTESVAC